MTAYNTRAAEARAAAKGRRKLSDVGALTYFVAMLAAGAAIVPVLYVIYSAFRSSGQLAAKPLALPDPVVLKNYETILNSGDFWKMLFASTVIAVVTTIGVVLLFSPLVLRAASARGGMFAGVMGAALGSMDGLTKWGVLLTAIGVAMLFI